MKIYSRSILIFIVSIFVTHDLFAQSDCIGNCEEQFQNWKRQELERQHSEFIGDTYTFPKILKQVAPVYPDSAKKYSIEGNVVLWCMVDTTGKPKCVRIIQTAGHDFDEAALLAIHDWQFEPVTLHGKKQVSPMTIPFRFRIKEKE